MTTLQAVDDHLRSCQPGWILPGRQNDRLELRRKASAQRLARAASRSIDDRKARQQARIELYNQLLPILERQYHAQRKLHRVYRQALTLVSAALVITLGVVLI